MASSGTKLEDNETKLSDGHIIRYSYYMRNLNTLQNYSYERSFTTNCQELPTSWLFKMLFQKEQDAGTISCTITLRRTDDGKIPLKPSVHLAFIRNSDTFILEKFQRNEILPGEKMQEFIQRNEILHGEKMQEFIQRHEILPGEKMQEFIAEVIPIKHMATTSYEMINITIMGQGSRNLTARQRALQIYLEAYRFDSTIHKNYTGDFLRLIDMQPFDT